MQAFSLIALIKLRSLSTWSRVFSFHSRNVKCSKNRGVKNTKKVTQLLKLCTMPFREAVVNYKKPIKRILIDLRGAFFSSVFKLLVFCITEW